MHVYLRLAAVSRLALLRFKRKASAGLCFGSLPILNPYPSQPTGKNAMRNNEFNSLEQLHKLVAENPVLQQQLQESHDLPSAMEAIRNFAAQRPDGLGLDQINADLSHVSHLIHAGNAIPDAQLEDVAAGTDSLTAFLNVITFGINAALNAEAEARRKYAEGYGG